MRFARRSSDSCCIMHLNLAIHLIALAIWVRSHYYVAIEFGDFTITPKTTSEKSMKSIAKTTVSAMVASGISWIALAGDPCGSDLLGSYSVNVPGWGREYVAWQFQASTLGQVIQSPPEETVAYFWNVSSQSWSIETFEFAQWTNPNRPILPGEGFLLDNPEMNDLTLTFQGSPVSGPVTKSLEADKWYLLGYAHPTVLDHLNFLECTYDGTVARYPVESLGYHASVGDTLYLWDAYYQTGSTTTRKDPSLHPQTLYWTEGSVPYGILLSPIITTGRSFFIKPSQNNTWVQYPAGECCGN